MKTKLLLASCMTVLMTACSTLPLPATVKEDHFRLENFKRTKTINQELIYVMCYHQRPTAWAEPKQYMAGEHNLWVRALVSKRGTPVSGQEAHANFKVNLPAGKSYMLNREIKDDNRIKLWIQEVDSGKVVSKVIETTLTMPKVYPDIINKRRCDTSSV